MKFFGWKYRWVALHESRRGMFEYSHATIQKVDIEQVPLNFATVMLRAVESDARTTSSNALTSWRGLQAYRGKSLLLVDMLICEHPGNPRTSGWMLSPLVRVIIRYRIDRDRR
jgi:hypothetical protein